MLLSCVPFVPLRHLFPIRSPPFSRCVFTWSRFIVPATGRGLRLPFVSPACIVILRIRFLYSFTADHDHTPRTSWDNPLVGVPLTALSIPFPPALVDIMRDGMLTYIPLTCLTTDACVRASSRGSWQKDLVKLEKGTLRLHTGGLDGRYERWISITDFLQASERFVDLIRQHFPDPLRRDDLVRGYSTHFRNVRLYTSLFSQPGLAMWYDCKARLEYQNRFILPTEFQHHIWAQVLADYSRLFNKRDFDAEGYPLPHPPGVVLPTSAVSSAGSSASPAPPARPSAPLPRRSWSRNDSNNRADNSRSSGSATPSASAVTRCFLCGTSQHQAKVCDARPVFLRRASDSANGPTFTTPSNGSVCYSYNARGCNRSPCTFSHLCSLCGHASHGAQQCTTV